MNMWWQRQMLRVHQGVRSRALGPSGEPLADPPWSGDGLDLAVGLTEPDRPWHRVVSRGTRDTRVWLCEKTGRTASSKSWLACCRPDGYRPPDLVVGMVEPDRPQHRLEAEGWYCRRTQRRCPAGQRLTCCDCPWKWAGWAGWKPE